MFHGRYDEGGFDGKPIAWIEVLREANRVQPGVIGAPSYLGPWNPPTWSVEEYEHARVLFRNDGTVSVIAKTATGDEVLRKAAEQLGLRFSEI